MKKIIQTSKIARITLITALTSLAMVALVACGGTSNPEPTMRPAAQPTSAATVAVVPLATEVATASADMGTIEVMPTAPAPESTSVPDGAGTTTMPTQPQAGDTGAGGGGGTAIQATLKEWSLTLSQGEVAAGKITFTVTNEGQFAHNLTVTDSSGEIARTSTFGRADSPQVFEVDLKPGNYTIICSLTGHAARGQTAQLVVK